MVIMNNIIEIKESDLFYNKVQVILDNALMKKDYTKMTMYLVSKPLFFFRRNKLKYGCRIYKSEFIITEETTDFCKKEERQWSIDKKQQDKVLNLYRTYLVEFAHDMFKPLLNAKGHIDKKDIKTFEDEMTVDGGLSKYKILDASSETIETLLDEEFEHESCPIKELIKQYKDYVSILKDDFGIAYNTGLSDKPDKLYEFNFDKHSDYDEAKEIQQIKKENNKNKNKTKSKQDCKTTIKYTKITKI